MGRRRNLSFKSASSRIIRGTDEENKGGKSKGAYALLVFLLKNFLYQDVDLNSALRAMRTALTVYESFVQEKVLDSNV